MNKHASYHILPEEVGLQGKILEARVTSHDYGEGIESVANSLAVTVFLLHIDNGLDGS